LYFGPRQRINNQVPVPEGIFMAIAMFRLNGGAN
jgi:hypothetical protein